MSNALQTIGFIGIMFAGSIADSENIKPFIAICFASIALMIAGIVAERMKRRRNRGRNGKFNYYFR